MYILLPSILRVRKYDVSHRGKWCDERVHIYFSHIIPTRKARVIYESCSTSLFTYTLTYIHARTQSCSRINFHCHTRRLHDLHLYLWTQRHRNPSVKYSRSVRLTYCLFSSLLSFCHSTEMAPPVLEMGKKNRQVRKIVWSRFWCRFARIQILEARKWQGRRRSDSVEFIELAKKSSWFFSRAVISHTPLVSSFFRLSRPPHWKNVNVVIQDRRNESYSYVWISAEKCVIRKSICMPSLRAGFKYEIVIWICRISHG